MLHTLLGRVFGSGCLPSLARKSRRPKRILRYSFCHPSSSYVRGVFPYVRKDTLHCVGESSFCHPHSNRLRIATVFSRFFGSYSSRCQHFRDQRERPEQDETSHRSLRKRAHRLAIVAAMWRRQVMAATQLLSGGQGPQGKKRRTESLFSWKDYISRLYDGTRIQTTLQVGF